jgi:hypothetical protein
VYYQLLKHGFPRDADIACAICQAPAEHRLLVSPTVLLSTMRLRVAVPPERRGLCRECGRGRHSLSFVADDEIESLRRDETAGRHTPPTVSIAR